MKMLGIKSLIKHTNILILTLTLAGLGSSNASVPPLLIEVSSVAENDIIAIKTPKGQYIAAPEGSSLATQISTVDNTAKFKVTTVSGNFTDTNGCTVRIRRADNNDHYLGCSPKFTPSWGGDQALALHNGFTPAQKDLKFKKVGSTLYFIKTDFGSGGYFFQDLYTSSGYIETHS
ncbi:hypothetical protein FJZ26_06250, partial [Candidatus Parvarchaeota archaeon]|nr:hypothetical protein [Candidatus Parvarchaeota archaeon]